MRIGVLGECGIDIDWDSLASILDAALAPRVPAGCVPELSVSFVGEGAIRELNARYREVDEPTDVLSFPLWESDGLFAPPDGWDDLPLGDIVVAPDIVRAAASAAGRGVEREMIVMLVHGALHLTGMDHATPEDEAEMFALQDALADTYLRGKEKR